MVIAKSSAHEDTGLTCLKGSNFSLTCIKLVEIVCRVSQPGRRVEDREGQASELYSGPTFYKADVCESTAKCAEANVGARYNNKVSRPCVILLAT